MSFVDAMRAATLDMHSSHMLAKKQAKKPLQQQPVSRHRQQQQQQQPSRLQFARYLVQQRNVFRALQTFPVRIPKRNFVEDINRDLWALNLHAEPGAYPELATAGTHSTYVRYLASLDTARLGCHWYNATFAHVAGGGLTVARAAEEDLPPGFFHTSAFYAPVPRDAVDATRAMFEAEAQSWAADQRAACLGETTEAFRHLGQISAILRAPQADGGESNITLDM